VRCINRRQVKLLSVQPLKNSTSKRLVQNLIEFQNLVQHTTPSVPFRPSISAISSRLLLLALSATNAHLFNRLISHETSPPFAPLVYSSPHGFSRPVSVVEPNFQPIRSVAGERLLYLWWLQLQSPAQERRPGALCHLRFSCAIQGTDQEVCRECFIKVCMMGQQANY
jgi:hypothetical protein